MATKRRITTASSKTAPASAPHAPASVPSEGVAVGRGGAAVVVAEGSGDGGSQSGPHNDRPGAGAGNTIQAYTGNTARTKTHGKGRGAKARGSLATGRGSETLSTDHQNPMPSSYNPDVSSDDENDIPPDSHSHLDAKIQALSPIVADENGNYPPAPQLPVPSLAHLKGTGLKNVGKDKNGKVIPHKRSEVLAAKICELIACGASENDIAIHFNIRPGLLRQCYGPELDHGAFAPNMAVAGAILDQAKKGNLKAGIFYAKARMGWRDGDSADKVQVSPLNIVIHM